jgi:hypothetical protein
MPEKHSYEMEIVSIDLPTVYSLLSSPIIMFNVGVILQYRESSFTICLTIFFARFGTSFRDAEEF